MLQNLEQSHVISVLTSDFHDRAAKGTWLLFAAEAAMEGPRGEQNAGNVDVYHSSSCQRYTWVCLSVCMCMCAPRSAAAFVCVMYFINRRSDSTTCLEKQKQPVLICDSCTSASRTEQRSSVDLFLVFAQMQWKMENLL